MAIMLERLVIVEACSVKLIGGVLRVRGKPNVAVEFTNGRGFLDMVANFQDQDQSHENGDAHSEAAK